MTTACILFMVRAPRLGLVKTRLARDVGEQAALALYQAFLADMLDSLAECGADVTLWVTPGQDAQAVHTLFGGKLRAFPQPEGDLGARMDYAFRWAFAQGYQSAAALGSDLPQLSPKGARDLARLTRSEPCLIGPCPDGGYWTIGFQAYRYLPEVFANMPWSAPDLLERTMALLTPLEPAVLPSLADIDTLDDLKRLMETCPAGLAQRTLAVAGDIA